jgi:hypothetical protein
MVLAAGADVTSKGAGEALTALCETYRYPLLRVRDLIRDEIAQTVSSPEEIEDELKQLWSSVSG